MRAVAVHKTGDKPELMELPSPAQRQEKSWSNWRRRR
jgi:hypothetical protein